MDDLELVTTLVLLEELAQTPTTQTVTVRMA